MLHFDVWENVGPKCPFFVEKHFILERFITSSLEPVAIEICKIYEIADFREVGKLC